MRRNVVGIVTLWVVAALGGAVVGCGPVSFVPGVRIGGAERAVPASWDGVEIPPVVQLSAGGGWLPRVVNIWAVEAEGAIYVSGSADAGWVERLSRDPDTLLRIGDSVYSLRAVPVDADDETRASVRAAYMEKYADEIRAFAEDAGVSPEEFGNDGRAFRLVPRSGP